MGKFLSQKDFVSKAKSVHNGKYDYSKAVYVDSKSKLTIICPIHGDFLQTPNRHLAGSGCPKCANESRSIKGRQTKEHFIERATKVHHGRYDYSKVEYVDCYTEVCITCPIHGDFWQAPHAHIKGHGCLYCSRRKEVGFCDMTHVRDLPSHHVWEGMIERCYLKPRPRNASYKDCSICEEWLTFSNFHKWFYEPENGYIEGYDIDKDLLIKGNRIYSPATCCFLPPEINKVFIKQKKTKNHLPIGVSQIKSGRFIARGSMYGNLHHLGTFDTPKEAFNAYRDFKERHIKSIAEKYFQEGKITKKVYDALMKYEVEITD